MSQKIKWYRTPIDRDVLKKLTVRSDLRGWIQVIGLLILFGATLYFPYFFFVRKMWIPMAVVGYFHCMMVSFLGTEAATHELSHRTPFKTKWLNEVFYYFFSFLTWNNPVQFRYSHTQHHVLTGYKDQDYELVFDPPAKFGFFDWLRTLTVDLPKMKIYLFTTIAHVFGNEDADYFHWNPLFPEGDERRKKMINFARFMFIGHLILLGVFIYFRLWVFIPLVTFGYFIGTFPSVGVVMMQHVGRCGDVPDWRLVARTVKLGPVLSFLYWNMHWHIEHHSYAAVPFFNLRKLHRELKYNMPVMPRGFIGGMKSVLKALKEQKKDAGYCQVPEFPETAVAPVFREEG